jgi:hypothetical protein
MRRLRERNAQGRPWKGEKKAEARNRSVLEEREGRDAELRRKSVVKKICRFKIPFPSLPQL